MNVFDTVMKGLVWLDRAEVGPFTYFDQVDPEQH